MSNFSHFNLNNFSLLVSMCHGEIETEYRVPSFALNKEVTDFAEQRTEIPGRGGRPGRTEASYPRMIV